MIDEVIPFFTKVGAQGRNPKCCKFKFLPCAPNSMLFVAWVRQPVWLHMNRLFVETPRRGVSTGIFHQLICGGRKTLLVRSKYSNTGI